MIRIAYCLLAVFLLFGCAADTTENIAEGGQATQPMDAETEALPESYEAPAAAPAAPALAEQVAGRWQSAADQKEIVEFTEDSYVSYYDGEKLIEEKLEWHEQCPGFCQPEGVSVDQCFTISGEFDITCYYVVSVTATQLQMSMLGGRGNTLIYNRVQ